MEIYPELTILVLMWEQNIYIELIYKFTELDLIFLDL
jgi:hypothetical protein